eukprot:11056520-Lingulodinium_polyedra.AAC.1
MSSGRAPRFAKPTTGLVSGLPANATTSSASPSDASALGARSSAGGPGPVEPPASASSAPLPDDLGEGTSGMTQAPWAEADSAISSSSSEKTGAGSKRRS